MTQRTTVGHRLLRMTGVALGGLITLGCAVGPNKKAPDIKTPEEYRDERAPGEKSFAELPWWEVHRDPTLFALLREATEKAYDLRVAMARVEIARQAHRAAVWALWPTIGVQAGVGDAIGTIDVPSLYPPQNMNSNFAVGAGASWEPDVWGRLRRLAGAAKHEFKATDEDRRGVYITLVGDVAQLYFSLLSLDLQREFAQQAIAARTETLHLFESRAGGGVSNELEVERARASLKQVEASLTIITLNIGTTQNALSYLLARLPSPIKRGASLDALQFLPEIPAGLPSTLLRRRPDVRSAEQILLAQNDKIGAELADFFPKFQLTGYLGVATPDLKDASFVRGGVGMLNWTLPFLGGERNRAEYAAAKAAWEGAKANYERAVGNAFREVANALITVSTLTDRRTAVDAQLAAANAAERHALERYRGGVADYLDVLTAQEQKLAVQLDVADVMGRQHSAVAQLYRALGGGWPLPDEDDDDKSNKKK